MLIFVIILSYNSTQNVSFYDITFNIILDVNIPQKILEDFLSLLVKPINFVTHFL